MSARGQIAFGNMLVGFGVGALLPTRPVVALAFAAQAAGLALIVRSFGRSDREIANRESSLR